MKWTAVLVLVTLVAAVGAAMWAAFRFVDETRPASTTTVEPSPPRRVGDETAATLFGELRRVGSGVLVTAQRVTLLADGDATQTTTDAQGVFRFDRVAPGGPYEVRVEAPNCAMIRIPGLAFDVGELRDLGTLRLGPPVRVVVRVRTWADEAVAGATVAAFRATRAPRSWRPPAAEAAAPQTAVTISSAVTDAAGDAMFDCLADGTWEFDASAPGFAPGRVKDARVRADAPNPSTIRLDAAQRLEGRVLDSNGRPAAGVAVVDGTFGHSSSGTGVTARTDAEGRFRFDALRIGVACLGLTRPQAGSYALARVRVPDVRSIDLRMPRSGLLRGRVTDVDSGRPLAGAMVVAYESYFGGVHRETATTDDRGRYEIACASLNSLHVEAMIHGFVTTFGERSSRSVAIRPDGVVTRDVAMLRGARLSGVVTSPDGPVSGAVVMIWRASPRHVPPRLTTVSDSLGRYEFACVPPGPTRLKATKPGFHPQEFPDAYGGNGAKEAWRPFTVDVATSGESRKDLELAPGGLVSGRVLGSDGTPLAGAEVEGDEAIDSVITGADGAFRLEGVAPTRAPVDCRKEAFELEDWPAVDVRSAEATEDVVLRMRPEIEVRGRVGSVDGKVPTGARVNDTVPVSRSGEFFFTTSSRDDLGEQDITEIVVSASAPGFAPSASNVEFVGGQAKYDVRLTLGPGVEIAGRVVTEDDVPIAGAPVFVEAREESHRMHGAPWDAVAATTDQEGGFRVAHLAPGQYVVGAEAPDRVPTAVVVATSSVATTIRLARASTIEGRIRFSDGRPAEGIELTAWVGGERLFHSMNGDRRDVTDAEGQFVISRLPQGKYSLRTDASWRSSLVVPKKWLADVAAGARDVEIVIDEGATIIGRVLNSKRSPLADVSVSARPSPKHAGANNRQTVRVDTSTDGSFTLRGLTPGPHRVEAWTHRSPGHQAARVSDVPAGAKGIEIVLADGLTISGVVVDAAGKPVAGLDLDARAIAEDAPHWGSSCVSESDGRFEIGGLSPGSYRIELDDGPSFPSSHVLDDDVTAAAGAVGLRLVASKADVVAGVVVDENGEAVAGVLVEARSADRTVRARATTTGDGRFVLRGLRTGEAYVVGVRMAGYGPAGDTAAVGGARNVRFVLFREYALTGRLLGADGKPLVKTSVGLGPVGRGATRFSSTDAKGQFSFDGLAKGSYEAWAFPLPTAATAGGAVRCGTVSTGGVDVELRLPK